MNEQLKEAFSKVKQDIFSLGEELSQLRFELTELKTEIKFISGFIEDFKLASLKQEPERENHQNQKKDEISELVLAFKELSFQLLSLKKEIESLSKPFPTQTPTHQQETPTHKPIPTDNPTLPSEIRGLLSPNKQSSIGNEGVPTDRQTNQQTDQHIILSTITKNESHLDKAPEILASLDNLKKEVRFKFKKLTNQEIQVFSLLYSLEDQGESVDYKLLSEKLNLSESSIRDYIGKIQKKGIPINKEKLNNKRVLLHISQDIRKIASLSTILQLREL